MANANRNWEQKFRCADLEAMEEIVKRLGAADRGVILQQDFFFAAPEARLKLRVFGDGKGELISYRRADEGKGRVSNYFIYPVEQPELLKATLTDALGPPRVVKKRRQLYLFYATRIHLDLVQGLGEFVELETVITTQTPEEAKAEHEAIVLALGLSEPVAGAYVDLLPHQ